MRILGIHIKATKQLDGGQGSRKAPGYYAEHAAAVPFEDGMNFGDAVQQAFVGVKEKVCTELKQPPNNFLKPGV